jgi:serine/threonine protein kinase
MKETTHGTPFEAPELEEVARLFPSYEILGLIACGGMGAVYHAIQTSLDRPVAIKILPREYSTDAEFRAGFEAEAKAMAKLNHPNLISVYDFGEVEGLLFIIMEFVAGQSLHQATHGCAVEHADAIKLVIGVCHGLEHAHEYGILHRDIKPSNILLDGQMNPKIGDFGLARALERQVEEGEQIFGTPGYTAPEVLNPPFTIDQRADIFSVGVMLHELLTGCLPDADPRPASQICGCNRRLDVVIRRATDPNPNRRYVSATEFAKELEKIAAAPTLTLGTTPSQSLSRPKPALSRPAVASSPRQQNALGQPKTFAKESSGTGLVIFLIVALIGAVAAYFVIKDRQSEALAPVSPPPKPAVIENSIPPPSQEPVVNNTKELDPQDILRRTRSSIRQRIGPFLESHRLDMNENLTNYKKAMKTASEGLPFSDRERIREALSKNLGIWEKSGYKLPDRHPTSFGVVENVADIHATYVEKQAALQRDLESEIASLAGVYVLELQNQIEQISKNGNVLAVAALEEEAQSVQEDGQRLRDIITD